MSIIVHGPQGCGKTLQAEALRRHFKMQRVVEEDSDDYPRDLYGMFKRDPVKFKGGDCLYLTSEAPPPTLQGARRIFPFTEVMRSIQQEGRP